MTTAGSTQKETNAVEAANHLRILLRGMEAVSDGYIELRTIPEKGEKRGGARSMFLPVTSGDDEINGAVKWMAAESKKGRGIFVGVNPRATEGGGSKEDVTQMTTAFLDLDIGKKGISKEDALAELKELSPIVPDLITDSGGGLHVLYFTKPTDNYHSWKDLQETLYEKFKHLGADRSVVTDSSRILRLTPFPNWKYEAEAGGRPTGIMEFTAREMIPSIQTASEIFDVRPNAGNSKAPSKLPDAIPEGGGSEAGEGRNQLLFKEASRLRNRGYNYEEILPALTALNEYRCVPPLPSSEVERIAEGVASRYEVNHSLGTSDDYIPGKFGYKLGEFLRDEFPPLDWVIHGLNNGELGQVVATPNIGKTTLALNLSMSMALGMPFMPLYEGGIPRRVMYLDFENRKAFLQKDIRVMIQNFDEDDRELIEENLFIAVDQEIYGVEMNLSNPDHLDILMREAHKFRPDLIIIDTMAAAFSLTNENDNSEAERSVIKPLKHVARETGAAILIVHHKGKKSETGDSNEVYAGRGASAFAAAFRLVLTLKPLTDGSGKQIENHVTLKAAKVKGKPFEDTVFALDFARRWFDAADITLPDETSSQESIWSLVTRPMKLSEVKDAVREAGLDISDSTVSRALRLGLQTGRLIRGSVTGQYAPSNEVAALPPAEAELDDNIIDAELIGEEED